MRDKGEKEASFPQLHFKPSRQHPHTNTNTHFHRQTDQYNKILCRERKRGECAFPFAAVCCFNNTLTTKKANERQKKTISTREIKSVCSKRTENKI